MTVKFLVSQYVVLFVVLSFAERLNAQQPRSLTEFKQTEFVPTLEHEIHLDKNAVYCPTLLFAWDELRNTLGGSINVDSLNSDLYLLNRSGDYKNTMLKSDYRVNTKISGNSIRVEAWFKSSLPLFEPMTSYDNGLEFSGKKVASFGDKGEGKGVTGVRYYKDDNNAIVSLLLKNPWHEILFFKTESNFRTMSEAIKAFEENIKAGTAEMRTGNNSWKFDLGGDDKLIIPKIKFDIKTDYPTMEGKAVYSKGARFDVIELSQQTAFALDEKGVEIESKGVGEVVFSEPVMDEERKPKKIVFDKPFFIFVKRKESASPYLVLWIANSELMK